jgi:hypothetical protein
VPSPSGAVSTGTSDTSATPRIFFLQGIVVSVDKTKQQIVVNHKDIPGFMGAMTMPYPVAVEDS